MESGALHHQHGLVAAFSRYSPQPSQQELLQMLQHAAAADTMQHQQQEQEQHFFAVGNNSSSNGMMVQPEGVTAAAAAAAGTATRTSSSSSSKVYVTHKIRQHGAAVWQLLSEGGGWVYVSGSAEKMPAGVVSALEDVAAQHGGLGPEAAAKFVRQLELTGRYHVEAWS